jgi:hypothetical protein
VDGAAASGPERSCEMLSYTDQNVTCLCSLVPGWDNQSGAGKRLLTLESQSTFFNGSVIGSYSVNYVSMLSSVSKTFTTTVLSASKLNVNVIKKGWQALVTVGMVFIGFAVALLVGHYADAVMKAEVDAKNGKKSLSNVIQSTKTSNSNGILSQLTTWWSTRKVSSDQLSSKAQLTRLSSFATTQQRRRPAMKKGFAELADEALPRVLTDSASLTTKIEHEMKRHHRWLGVAFHFSRRFPRMLRIVSLGTNIVSMLFIQSLTYNLTNGDDGSCERLTNEQDCLLPHSPFATGSSKCSWLTINSSCHFVQPDSDMMVIVFVAVFSALLSTPIALFSDWLLQNVLSAPTVKFTSTQAVFQHQEHDFHVKPPSIPSSVTSLVSIVPSGVGSTRRGAQWQIFDNKNRDILKFEQLSQADLKSLTAELSLYRLSLNDTDRQEFDCEF